MRHLLYPAAVVLPLLPLLAPTTAAAEPSAWRPDGMVGAIQVERRDVAGSSYDELRLTTTSPLGLNELCAAVYPRPWTGKLEGRFKKKELLRETDNERWTYEQIAVPIASDRDYVMHVVLEQDAPTGRCEVSFATEDQGVRAPPPGFVRVAGVRGHWSLVPASGGGKVLIRYQVWSDPGGGVPAFLARGGQKDSAVDFMKVILARATALPPSAGPAAAH